MNAVPSPVASWDDLCLYYWGEICGFRFNHYTKQLTQIYLGIMRFTVPMGKISIDFPQNLFFHLTSEKQTSKNIRNKQQWINFVFFVWTQTIGNKISVYSVKVQLDIKEANLVMLTHLQSQSSHEKIPH